MYYICTGTSDIDYSSVLNTFLSGMSSNDIVSTGSHLLNQFVQLNWTGPKDMTTHIIPSHQQVIILTVY